MSSSLRPARQAPGLRRDPQPLHAARFKPLRAESKSKKPTLAVLNLPLGMKTNASNELAAKERKELKHPPAPLAAPRPSEGRGCRRRVRATHASRITFHASPSLRSLRSLAAKIPCLPFACLACLAGLLSLQAAEFTTPTTISETDTTYDGQDIVINSTTVAIDGAHSFSSLLLTNNTAIARLRGSTTRLRAQARIPFRPVRNAGLQSVSGSPPIPA